MIKRLQTVNGEMDSLLNSINSKRSNPIKPSNKANVLDVLQRFEDIYAEIEHQRLTFDNLPTDVSKLLNEVIIKYEIIQESLLY